MGNMEAEERKEEGTPSGETLEAAFGKLDQMLETLESSDVSLEDSFRLYTVSYTHLTLPTKA